MPPGQPQNVSSSPWEVAASFIPFIGGAISSSIQAKKQRQQDIINIERTIAANKELAEYQYSKDLEQWNRANVYNTPQAQMERLKQAGLNPNLVYGSGSAAGNMAAQLPKYNAPTVDYSGIPAGVDTLAMALGQFQDVMIKQAQYDNLKADQALKTNRGGMIRQQLDDLINSSDDRYQREYYKTMLQAYDLFEKGMFPDTGGVENLDMVIQKIKGGRTYTRREGLRMPQSMAGYQGEFKRAALGKIGADVARMNAATAYTQKQNEWFVTKLIGQLGLGLVNTAGKFISPRGSASLLKSAGKAPQMMRGGAVRSGSARARRFNSQGAYIRAKQRGYVD